MDKKKRLQRLLFIIICECFIVFVAFLFCKYDYNKRYTEEVYSQEVLKDINGNLSGGYYVDGGQENFADKQLGLDDILLAKGSYHVEIEYETRGTSFFYMQHEYGRAEFNLSGKVYLEEGNTKQKFEIVVKDDVSPIVFYGQLSENSLDSDYLLIRNVSVRRSFSWYSLAMFWLIILMSCIDFSLCIWWNIWHIKFSKENRMVIAGVLCITFVASIPLLTNYLQGGHDLLFHLARIEGIKEGILKGNLPVRIQSSWLNEHGYPVSVFYGDLFLYIPAVLRMIGFSLQDVYKVYVVLVNMATVLVAYFCFKKIGNSKNAAIVSSAVYTLSLYRITNIYVRGAVGEYTAMIFFPLVLYGLWYTFSKDLEEIKNNKVVWVSLGIGYTGILYTHIISCVMIAVFSILTCILLIKRVFQKERLLMLLKSCMLTLILGVGFWIPLLDYMRLSFRCSNDWTEVYQQNDRGMFWAQFFNAGYKVTGENQSLQDGMRGEMPLTLGVGFLVLVLIIVVMIICNYKALKNVKEWKVSLILLLTAMWMCTKDFPYEVLANKWEVFRFLSKNIQFPWRFLTMVSLISAWLCLLILTKVDWKEIGERYKELVIYGLMLVLILDASNMMGRVMSEKEAILIFSGANLRSTNVAQGEYLYEGIDETDYVNEITDIGKDLELLNWQREKGGLLVEVINKGATDNTLELPLIFYKGYEAYDAVSKQRMELSAGKSHRIQLHLNAGYNGRVNIEFVEPWYWRIAEVISFVSCIIIAVKLFLLYYKKEDAA